MAVNTTLCAPCRSIFKVDREPGFLNEQSIPSDTTVAHHERVQSFQEAVQNGCQICRVVDTDGASATRARLVKTRDGEYTVAIFQSEEGQLGKVTYFTATQGSSLSYSNDGVTNHNPVAESSSFNVPASQHAELVRRWTSECQAKPSTDIARRPQRVLELKSDETSGKTLVRLQDVVATHEMSYVSVVQDATATQSGAVDSDDNISTWQTTEQLPSWLQNAVRVANASSIRYIWEATLCAQYGDSASTAEIYAGAVFNIALIAGSGSSRSDAIPILSPAWAPQSLLAVYQNTMFRHAVVETPVWKQPSFHQALLLAPATLYITNRGSHLWWHCGDGAVYGDVVAAGVPISDDSSEVISGIRMLGTHTLDTRVLLAQLLHSKGSAPVEDRLAALWTSVAMAYSQTGGDEKALQDAANVMRNLLSTQNNDKDTPVYAHGAWSSGLIYQLCWHGDPMRQDELPARSRQSIPSWSWLSSLSPIVFEFLVSSEAAGLVVPYLDSTRAKVVPVASATFCRDNSRIRARGTLLEANLESSESTGILNLADKYGEAGVHFDSEEEEVRSSKTDSLPRYMAWPIFAHVDEDERLESRGVILREMEKDEQGLQLFVRCGWFQYSSADQEVAGSAEELLKLAKGDESTHVEFLIL
jgi:hypothetical protein